VAPAVTGSAGGGNVFPAICTTIALGLKMLSRTSERMCLANRDT